MVRQKNTPASSQNADVQPPPRGKVPTRTYLNTFFSDSSDPVGDIEAARAWLVTNNWAGRSETISRDRLVNILLAIVAHYKLAAEPAAAIRAVAYVLEETNFTEASSALSDIISNKLISKLQPITDELTNTSDELANSTEEITKASSFTKATTTQHAEALIKLTKLTSKLDDISSKLTSTGTSPHTNNWPSLPPLTRTHNTANNSMEDDRIQQRIHQAARLILIQVDPPTTFPSPSPNPQALTKIRDDINTHLKDLDEFELDPDSSDPLKTVVKGIQALNRGGFLFELDSPKSAERFKDRCSSTDLVTKHFGTSAKVKAKHFNLIIRFVPCDGTFDPADPTHLTEFEKENSLKPGDVASATWIKKVDRRAPGQKVASIKLACTTPEAANKLLQGRIYVSNYSVNVRKDIREPIRCNKCQEYGHIRNECKGVEKCPQCTSTNHLFAACRQSLKPCCVSCGPLSTHPSTSRTCPTFLNKCHSLELRYPESSLPFFPTNEQWTRVTAPPKLSTSPPQQFPIRPRPHPTINLDLTQNSRLNRLPAHPNLRQSKIDSFTRTATPPPSQRSGSPTPTDNL